MTKKEKDLEKARCLDNLKKWLDDGDCLYMTTERTKSGMTRYIRVFHPVDRNDIYNLTYTIGIVTGYPIKDRCGSWYLMAKGCGYSAADAITDAVMYATGLKLRYRDL